MSKLLRFDRSGDTIFITSVTANREPFLANNEDTLLEKIQRYSNMGLYDLLAWVILPDHFHIIIHPQNDKMCNIMRKIKLSFAFAYREKYGIYRKTIWQKRFWDHIIRNQDDLSQHIDYIHYNPVKHGITYMPSLWKYTSYHGFIKNGYYRGDWGTNYKIDTNIDYGE